MCRSLKCRIGHPHAAWDDYCRAIEAGQPEGDLGWDEFRALFDMDPEPSR